MDYKELHGMVEAYYSSNVLREWNRLGKKGTLGWLEHYTTLRYLKKYLPKKGLILDGGSGPGRYGVELAAMGYKVLMLDPVRENLEFAKRVAKRDNILENIAGFTVGRIENLSQIESESFDAVISLGAPLSHIMNARMRRKAALELIRVAKYNAPIFVSVIGRLQLISGLLIVSPKELAEPYVSTWLKSGDFKGKPVFTPYHGFLPEELTSLFDSDNFRKISMVSLEGLSSWNEPALKRLHANKKLFCAWLKLHMDSCGEPSILGASNHIMLIGKRVHKI
jgi:2-polyprenyl-3-methyl-5-hydroxy-6-metoxy-1,4-benzoquinol methylase